MMRITTESGSVYIIDHEKKTWVRFRGPKAVQIRTDEGTFEKFDIKEECIVMLCPPYIDDGPPRLITSTQITEINDDLVMPSMQ